MRNELPASALVVASVFLVLAVCSTAQAITVFKVATTDDDEAYPSVSGGTVVWQDNRDDNWDIYAAIVDGEEVATGAEDQ